jgi:protein-L-isoaspartate O-methyltransferase
VALTDAMTDTAENSLVEPPIDTKRLLEEIGIPDLPLARAWAIRQLQAEGLPARALQAVARIPRHGFAPRRWRVAYLDLNLYEAGAWIPTARQVARVVAALPPNVGLSAVELDPGSGYQTAVLAASAVEVTTVGASPDARHRLAQLGLTVRNAEVPPSPASWSTRVAVLATGRALEQPLGLRSWLPPQGGIIIAAVHDPATGCRLIRYELRPAGEVLALDLGNWWVPTAPSGRSDQIVAKTSTVTS